MESREGSRLEDFQRETPNIEHSFDATKVAADKTVHDIIGKLTSSSNRRLRQVVHQAPFIHKVLRQHLGLRPMALQQSRPMFLNQKPFRYPIGPNPYLQQHNLENIGKQVSSSIQHLVNSHIESTIQQNLAAHEMFSKLSDQQIHQPQVQPQFVAPNRDITHHVNIGQPQVSFSSYSHHIITGAGHAQNCQNVPGISHPEVVPVPYSGQTFDSVLPQGHSDVEPASAKPIQEYEDTQQEQKTLDIIHLDDPDDQKNLIETPESNIDVRFGN